MNRPRHDIRTRPSRPPTRQPVCRLPGQPRHAREGNSLVLVTALLVLLVIIATAYLGRTRSERVVSVAQQQSALRDGRASVIADDLAREVAEALFVRPINRASVGPIQTGVIANPNTPRLPIPPDAVRYGVDDRNVALAGSPQSLGYEYNFAPHNVVPFTNWPDFPLYPRGATNPNGALGVLGESNPAGGPGFGDARWLRDPEPARINLRAFGIDPSAFGLDPSDEVYVFSHWRKMSNIARPENGWRMVYDISNVMDSVVTELGAPIEQWLAFPYPGTIAGTPFGSAQGQMWQGLPLGANSLATLGTRQVVAPVVFENQWNLWINSHATTYRNVNFIPNNFYRLSNLNPQTPPNSFGERPEDEFNGPGTVAGGATGTARWSVSRTLADADGSGYTDAFWFLAPTMVEGGLRQIVAVSIVDNGGLINVNTASRFIRSDTATGIDGSRTTGLTPADTALVGQNIFNNFASPLDNWNTGFFDTFLNQSPNNGPFFGGTAVRFRPEMWSSNQTPAPVRELNVLGALGVKGNIDYPNLLLTQRDRVRYFRSLAARFDDPADGLTPFGIADEIELRMFASSNNAETLSALERAVDTRVYDPIGAGFVGAAQQQLFLRSDDFREESSDWFDRLSVPDLVRDNRRKITTYNATRNELMPPWLWPSSHPNAPQVRYDQSIGNFVFEAPPTTQPALNQWQTIWANRIRKVDLRAEPISGGAIPSADATVYLNAVQDALARAFAIVRPNPANPASLIGSSYFGNFVGGPFTGSPDAFRRSIKMSESFAANIAAARDEDDIPLSSEYLISTRPDVVDGVGFARRRFPGMERHPFLVEAFVGHVYPVYTVPVGYPNSGARTVFSTEPGGDGSDISTTIVAVQIANPFDTTLPLRNLADTAINEENLTPQFELEIFGQVVPLRDLATADGFLDRLRPTTDREPRVVTLYAVVDSYSDTIDFRVRWLDFLDVTTTAVDPRALPWARSLDLNTVPGVSISLSRSQYDNHTGPAVQIVRLEPQITGVPRRFVVDRIDRLDAPIADSFREAVREMQGQAPPPGPNVLPPLTDPFPIDGGWVIPGIDGDQWVQWRRVARAFGYGRSATRYNPRYVYGNREISRPVDFVDAGTTPSTYFRSGNLYRSSTAPDSPWFGQPMQLWEVQQANTLTDFYRKPTTFNLRWGEQFYSVADDAPIVGNPDIHFPDTGFYHSPNALQMLQRNRDFDRVGDLAWVWLWGPEMNIEDDLNPFIERTFAEIMSREAAEYPPLAVGTGATINRLRLNVQTFAGAFGSGDDVISPTIGGVPIDHSLPALPAWARVYDAFTCDGAGFNPPDLNGDGVISAAEREAARMRLASGYTGRPIHGLLNVNTAPIETLRAMPHMTRLVDEGIGSFTLNPRVRWPEGIVAYRDRAGDWEPNEAAPVFPGQPPYGGRGTFGDGGATVADGFQPRIRSERGVAGIGELLLVDARPLDQTISDLQADSWRRSFAARGPFGTGVSTNISTDTFNRFQPDPVNPLLGTFQPDFVAGDLEEETLLFSGIANLVTTRSDTFTVYFKVRTFRQDPVTGRWDALKRENIVDDSRYVMVVDRSNVNSPSDRPRILFLEKTTD